MKPNVVIIGAGASGLYAAYCLVTRGLTENIIVLEAEDRVGGRIHSIPFNGHWLELGATWIHGRGENLLWKFVEKKQVNSKLIFHTTTYVCSVVVDTCRMNICLIDQIVFFCMLHTLHKL